jgi:hypothetical protein
LVPARGPQVERRGQLRLIARASGPSTKAGISHDGKALRALSAVGLLDPTRKLHAPKTPISADIIGPCLVCDNCWRTTQRSLQPRRVGDRRLPVREPNGHGAPKPETHRKTSPSTRSLGNCAAWPRRECVTMAATVDLSGLDQELDLGGACGARGWKLSIRPPYQ